MKTRVGTVPYVNALPLFLPILTGGNPNLTLVFDFPRKLSDSLAGGLLQAALCPALHVVMGDFEMLPTHGVISRGRVGSVHLYSKKDPKDWQTVATDPSSLSSASLIQVLNKRHFKNQARLVKMDKEKADAYLLIGDADLKHQKEATQSSWDLGEEWTTLTGLPFLYAAWIVRPTISTGIKNYLDESFISPSHVSVQEALEDMREQTGLELEDLSRYLSNNIHYKIDDEVLEGFRTFVRYFSEIRHLPQMQPRLSVLNA